MASPYKTLIRRDLYKTVKARTTERKVALRRIREQLKCICGKSMERHINDYVDGRWVLCLPENDCRGFKLPADVEAERLLKEQEEREKAAALTQ